MVGGILCIIIGVTMTIASIVVFVVGTKKSSITVAHFLFVLIILAFAGVVIDWQGYMACMFASGAMQIPQS